MEDIILNYFALQEVFMMRIIEKCGLYVQPI